MKNSPICYKTLLYYTKEGYYNSNPSHSFSLKNPKWKKIITLRKSKRGQKLVWSGSRSWRCSVDRISRIVKHNHRAETYQRNKWWKKAYWKKNIFSWPHLEYTRMSFDLCNGSVTFQCIMDNIFKDEIWKFAIPYLDDIIIFSESREDHKKHLEIVFDKWRAASLYLKNKKKSHFWKNEVQILGLIMGNGIVRPDSKKISVIRGYGTHQTHRKLRSFLGLANYFRTFITNYAHKTKKSNEILKNREKISIEKICFTVEQKMTFNEVEDEIAETTIRCQPDLEMEMIRTADASDSLIGIKLSQKDMNGRSRWYRISKTLYGTQKSYSITYKEPLVVVKGIDHFKHYLWEKVHSRNGPQSTQIFTLLNTAQ